MRSSPTTIWILKIALSVSLAGAVLAHGSGKIQSASSADQTPGLLLPQEKPYRALEGTFERDHVRTFAGSIDNRVGITMKLEKHDSSLRGTYSYDMVGTDIAVRGEVDAEDRVVLDETDNSGAIKAQFTGRLVSIGILAGTWRKAGPGKDLPFLLKAFYESSAGTYLGADDRTIVVEQRVVLKNSDGEAVVHYPVISGLNNPSVLDRIKGATKLKRVLGSSLDDLVDEVGWLREVNYKVNYDRDYILDITFWEYGEGAYPDTHYGHAAFNLKTGAKLIAADVFEQSSMTALEALVKRKYHTYDRVAEGFPHRGYQRKDLDKFRVDERGVTFLWEFGFPHVGKGYEPRDGGFFFTYAELRNYIAPTGLLGVNIRH